VRGSDTSERAGKRYRAAVVGEASSCTNASSSRGNDADMKAQCVGLVMRVVSSLGEYQSDTDGGQVARRWEALSGVAGV